MSTDRRMTHPNPNDPQHRIDHHPDGVRPELVEGLERGETVEAEGGVLSRFDIEQIDDGTSHVDWEIGTNLDRFARRLRALYRWRKSRPKSTWSPLWIWASCPGVDPRGRCVDSDVASDIWAEVKRLGKVGVTVIGKDEFAGWLLVTLRDRWRGRKRWRLLDWKARPASASGQ